MPHFKKQMASFFLTTKCNLHCKYCYNREQREPEKEQSLPLDIAKAGIDYFFSTNESRHIRFYGPGEPTREFPLMKDIVGYARVKAGGLVTVELQTNGVFDKEVRQWLLDNVNIIWISFDGEPAIHDANRKFKDGRHSSPVIEENVKWLIGNKGANNLLVGARVTVTNETVRKQKRIVDYLAALGVRYIWNDPLFRL